MIKYMGNYYHDKEKESSWEAYPHQCAGFYLEKKHNTIIYNRHGGIIANVTPFAGNFFKVNIEQATS